MTPPLPASFLSGGAARLSSSGQTTPATANSSTTTILDASAANEDASVTTAANRSKNIKVCVRLRPLTVQRENSSNSFYKNNKQQQQLLSRTATTTPQRKPAIPRLRGNASKLPTPSAGLSSPPPHTNAAAAATTYAWNVIDDDTVTQNPDTDIVPGRTHTYTFDQIYGPESHNAGIYQHSVQELVSAAMEGYHTAILAYGQTSTGKTHTMTGTTDEPGLIPLSIQECFKNIREHREYLLRLSYLEVYKEHIKDLLAKNVEPIRLFESNGNLQIRGLREEVVTTPEQVFSLLAEGEARRQVGATHMNLHSSRSHVIVRLWIESRDDRSVHCRGGGNGGNNNNNSNTSRVSSLSLVDLAGSESVRLNGSNSERRSEGQYINKSLMTLGQVVKCLSSINPDSTTKRQQTTHIPYRDSKLTRLLQPSLSGNAQVVLICCISPLISHVEESHNTFKFAMRAKKIPQKAKLQEVNEKTLLQSYREEIEDLKQQLQEAEKQRQELVLQKQQNSNVVEAAEDAEEEMQELVEAIQTMEKLILKTRQPDDDILLHASTPTKPKNGQSLAADTPNGIGSRDEEETNKEEDHFKTPATARKVNGNDDDLHQELGRIQGLLGSVMKKRRPVADEVQTLRAKLEEQSIATTLRQADSSFLQRQLVEKDTLLAEVSKLLEAVEEKQSALEKENLALRKELDELKAAQTQ